MRSHVIFYSEGQHNLTHPGGWRGGEVQPRSRLGASQPLFLQPPTSHRSPPEVGISKGADIGWGGGLNQPTAFLSAKGQIPPPWRGVVQNDPDHGRAVIFEGGATYFLFREIIDILFGCLTLNLLPVVVSTDWHPSGAGAWPLPFFNAKRTCC